MSNNEHKVIALCCHNAISFKEIKKENLEVIKLPCTGKVETLHLLKLFENGIDGICIVGCLEGECHFLEGNLRAKKRVQFTKKLLDEIGLGGDRLKMYNTSYLDEKKLTEIVCEMNNNIKNLGKNPMGDKK